MQNSRVMKFEDIVERWRENNCPLSLTRMLGLSRSDCNEDDQEVYERFKGTFWEISWANPDFFGKFDSTASYRYLSDSFIDALRLRPDADYASFEKFFIIFNQCCADTSEDIDFEEDVRGVFEGFDDDFSDLEPLSCYFEPDFN